MLYEVSYMSAAGIPSILHVNADSSERAQAYFCETETGAEFCGIREGASSSRPGVPSVTVPADWQPHEIETAAADEIETSDDKGGSAPAVKLANLIPLKSKITVYVPSTVNVNEAIDNSAQVERVARLLSECFGGATASPVSGYWVAADKSLVVEHTTMVFAFCDTASAEKYIDDVVRLCVSLKHEMGQEAIALEYNGEMYFI